MRLGWKILLPISLGFVILYAGIYYDKIYSIFYEYYFPIINLQRKNFEFQIFWEEFYTLLSNKQKLWHNFRIHEWYLYGWNWTQYGRPQIIYNYLNNIDEILKQWNLVKKGINLYWEVRANKIFKIEKYDWVSEVININKRYDLKLIVKEERVLAWRKLREIILLELNNNKTTNVVEKSNNNNINIIENNNNNILDISFLKKVPTEPKSLKTVEEMAQNLDWNNVTNFDYYEIKRLEKIINRIDWQNLEKEIIEIKN